MKLSFNEFLIKFIKEREKEIVSDYFKPGCNGLYNDPETPIRNNCHYLVVYSYLYKETNSDDYLKKIHLLEDYVLNNYYYGYTYEFRNKENKDRSNGIIGTGWISEGLIYSYQVTNNQKVLDRLIEIYKQYPFDGKKGIWTNRVEPDGEILTIDRTLNHQIWFTAGLAMLLNYINDEELQNKLNIFISKLPDYIKTTNKLIYHTLGISKEYYRTSIKRLIKKKYKNEMRIKEVGYHYFNVLGVQIIDMFTDSQKKYLQKCFSNSVILKANQNSFIKLSKNNKYGYPYNPVGIEIASVYSYLNKDIDLILEGLNRQFIETWDIKNFSFYNTNDINTLNARVYELLYIKDSYRDKIYFNTEKGLWRKK